MEARYDFKNNVTHIKLRKKEAENRITLLRLKARGAAFNKETSKFIWYMAAGNILPIQF